MTNKPNVTSKYEEERLRAAEQSQFVYLQGQIDELRRLIKDQTNKYNWAMEQVRKVEAGVVQIEGLFDRYRQEVTQSLEGYRRDITTLRKEIAGALVKVEEGSKPIREMQTQIHQLGEVRKQDRDQLAGWMVRIEELEQRTLTWQAQIRDHQERLAQAGAEARANYEKAIAGMRESVEQANRLLAQSREAQESAWRDMQVASQSALEQLQKGWADALRRFG